MFRLGIVNIVALWGFSLKEILVARYIVYPYPKSRQKLGVFKVDSFKGYVDVITNSVCALALVSWQARPDLLLSLRQVKQKYRIASIRTCGLKTASYHQTISLTTVRLRGFYHRLSLRSSNARTG